MGEYGPQTYLSEQRCVSGRCGKRITLSSYVQFNPYIRLNCTQHVDM